MTVVVRDVRAAHPPSAVDPHLQPAYLLAVAEATGQRAVEVSGEGSGWSVQYPLLLQSSGAGWLARSPDYGGPVIEADDPLSALPAVRCAIDDALKAFGVISEVCLSSPWLPHLDALATSWDWRPRKPVCVWALPPDLASVSHGRRADLRNPMPTAEGLLDERSARAFAQRYAVAMERIGAAPRWRLDEDYFVAIAGTGLVHHVQAGDETSGAAGLFLHGGSHAAYLFSVRWGAASGGPSRVLWRAAELLAERGAVDLLLGGGASGDADDPLLAFKRSWGGREVPQLIGARCFDPAEQARAEAEGARPLPLNAVAA